MSIGLVSSGGAKGYHKFNFIAIGARSGTSRVITRLSNRILRRLPLGVRGTLPQTGDRNRSRDHRKTTDGHAGDGNHGTPTTSATDTDAITRPSPH